MMCSASCIPLGEFPSSTLCIMDREDPSAIVLLSCDEGISEQLSDQAAGDSHALVVLIPLYVAKA